MLNLIEPRVMKTASMSSITSELAAVVATVRRPSDLFVSTMIGFLAPQLEVEGLTTCSLLSQQCEQAFCSSCWKESDADGHGMGHIGATD
jgi:hypothetical protein